MSTKYPVNIDSEIELPIAKDNTTAISEKIVNNLRGAILAVERELGIKPSGIYTNVRGRLDAIDNLIEQLQESTGNASVNFGGDISLLSPISQTVVGLRNVPISSGSLSLGDYYVYESGAYNGGSPRFKKKESLALDPRDFGCPWNGIDDDLPGLNDLIGSISASENKPVKIQLPPGQGYCSDNWKINRRVEIFGHGKSYASATSLQNGIKFAPMKGIIFEGYFSSQDFPGGRSDNSSLNDCSIITTQAIVSDPVGNWGRSMYQLDTGYDIWSNLPSTVRLGTCVIKSGSPVGSPPSDYYGDGTTRNATHLVMFRCTTSGTKGNSEPSAFATSNLSDIGTTIGASGGTAIWTVESIPKDYDNQKSYSVGERVFLSGDPDHVFECEISGISKGWSTVIAPASDSISLPSATIEVADTSSFPSSGTMRVITSNGAQTVSYSGTTATSFTGCSGGTGIMSLNNVVSSPYNYSDWGLAGRIPDGFVAPAFEESFYDIATTISVLSNGASLPTSTINVTSTLDFSNSGTIQIWTGSSYTSIAYTGKTDTSFTGCSGGTGTLLLSAEVGQGIKWKHVPGAEGICVLGNWVNLNQLHIAGSTGAAVWITGNYKRLPSGPGGSNFWAIKNSIINSCGSGLSLNSNNANGGGSSHCQYVFIGAGRTNVDNPEYLNIGNDRWGNGSAGVKDRVQGNNKHEDHYVQFSGGMPFRNDLFTPTPTGNATLWSKLAAESDFSAEILFPALVISSPYGVSLNSSASIIDGSLSKNIRTSSPLISNSSKKIQTVLGPQNNGSTSAITIGHEDDSYQLGFNVSDDILYLPTKWWSFGKANGSGFFDQQAFLIPRPSPTAVTWPGGDSVGSELPMWIANDRLWIGQAPNIDPPSIGFGNAIPTAGYYVKGSVIWNRNSEIDQLEGWRCIATGSPGTWASIANLNNLSNTQADWYIDSVSGDDAADGSSALTPVRTFQEIRKRLNGKVLFPPADPSSLAREVRFHLLENLPDTDHFVPDFSIGQDVVVRVIGEATSTVASGTFSAVQIGDSTTNTKWLMTGTGLGSFIGKRLRISSGLRVDTIMWIIDSVTADQVWVSSPSLPDALDPVNDPYGFTIAGVTDKTPQVGDSWVVEDLTTSYFGYVGLRAQQTTDGGNGYSPMISFESIEIKDSAIAEFYIQTRGVTVNMISSKIGPICVIDTGNYSSSNCYFSRGCIGGSADAGTRIYGGLIGSSVANSSGGVMPGINNSQGTCGLWNDVHIVDCGIVGDKILITSACIWNATTNIFNPSGAGLFAGGSSIAGLGGEINVRVKLWGAGNQTFGVKVFKGSAFVIEPGAVITITGTSGDFSIENKTLSWTDSLASYILKSGKSPLFSDTNNLIYTLPIESIPAAVTPYVAASHSLISNATTTVDFILTVKRNGGGGGTLDGGGRWGGSVTYQVDSGGTATLLGVANYSTAQENIGDTVAFNLAGGNVLEVIHTPANATARNVTCEIRVQEQR